MYKFKNALRKFGSNKALVACTTVGATMGLTCVGAFADDATTTAMSTALTSVKTDSISALAIVAPIAIGIMGAFLVWKFGIRFFKGLAK